MRQTLISAAAMFAIVLHGCDKSKKSETGTEVASSEPPRKNQTQAPKAPPKQESGNSFGGGGGFSVGGPDDASPPKKSTGGGFGDPGNNPDFASQFEKEKQDRAKELAKKGSDKGETSARTREILSELEAENFFQRIIFSPKRIASRMLSKDELKSEISRIAAEPSPKPRDVSKIISRIAPKYTRIEIQNVFTFLLDEPRNDYKAEIAVLKKLYLEANGPLAVLDTAEDAKRYADQLARYQKEGNQAGIKQMEAVNYQWAAITSKVSWPAMIDKESFYSLLKEIDRLKDAKGR